ncbi:MAG: phosphatidylserine decarboxylase family protein [Flavobacteriales bacterium]|nr:phosphatidylserine decarboxylase family protein [Flavobacteriales bacterium]
MIKGFHREGRSFLVISSVVGAGLIYLLHSIDISAFLFWFLTAAIIVFLYLFFQFFRIPSRKVNSDESILFSPCDGKVVVIEEVKEEEYLNERCKQISIFMSPLNVHMNWYPASGEVLYQKYHPGKYLVAWHPKSSSENERTTVAVQNTRGKYLMRQIAGAVARRIICYSQKGDSAAQNTEMGFIKFGSRVDVFVPLSAEIKVEIGDVVKGTTTPLAYW